MRLESQVPAKAELPALKDGEVGELQHALTGTPAKTATEEQISQVLRYVMVKLGLKENNWPVPAEKALQLSHIVTNYGNHTLAELRLAFDMALAGRLDLEAKQIPCYENFSCEYISRIMNSYRRWAAEAYKQIPQAPPEPKAVEGTGDAAMMEWWLDFVKQIKAGTKAVEFVPMMLYEWKEKRGEVLPAMAESEEYLVRAMERRFVQLQRVYQEQQTVEARRKLTEFSKMRDEGVFTGEHVDYLKKLAKRMVLFDVALATK